jgi:hypothetical protein
MRSSVWYPTDRNRFAKAVAQARLDRWLDRQVSPFAIRSHSQPSLRSTADHWLSMVGREDRVFLRSPRVMLNKLDTSPREKRIAHVG